MSLLLKLFPSTIIDSFAEFFAITFHDKFELWVLWGSKNCATCRVLVRARQSPTEDHISLQNVPCVVYPKGADSHSINQHVMQRSPLAPGSSRLQRQGYRFFFPLCFYLQLLRKPKDRDDLRVFQSQPPATPSLRWETGLLVWHLHWMVFINRLHACLSHIHHFPKRNQVPSVCRDGLKIVRQVLQVAMNLFHIIATCTKKLNSQT